MQAELATSCNYLAVVNGAYDKSRPYDGAMNAFITRMRTAPFNDGRPVVIEGEEWPTNVADPKLEDNLDKLCYLIDYVRAGLPGRRIGIYNAPMATWWGVVPWSRLRRGLDKGKENPLYDYYKTAYAAWQAQVARIAHGLTYDGKKQREGLADKLDFVCPSLYTYYEGSLELGGNWQAYCVENCREARKLNTQVYPFICPLYHPSTHPYKVNEPAADPATLPWIDAASWRFQLECLLACEDCDGFAIWTSNNFTLDVNMPWWRATLDFLAAHGLKQG